MTARERYYRERHRIRDAEWCRPYAEAVAHAKREWEAKRQPLLTGLAGGLLRLAQRRKQQERWEWVAGILSDPRIRWQFWACPKECRGRVTWAGDVATCAECGGSSADDFEVLAEAAWLDEAAGRSRDLREYAAEKGVG